MADYIDREILCQAYIHIEADLSDGELANLKKHLEQYVRRVQDDSPTRVRDRT
jgi:hypothetical protein